MTATQQQKFGPFQQAANKLLQFAIDNNVPNAREIVLDGQLGKQWKTAFDAIFEVDTLRPRFDYGVLREVRDDLIPVMGRWGFVDSIGHTDGHFKFLGLLRKMARKEAELTIVSWDRQREVLRTELHQLLDWTRSNELLNWNDAA